MKANEKDAFGQSVSAQTNSSSKFLKFHAVPYVHVCHHWLTRWVNYYSYDSVIDCVMEFWLDSEWSGVCSQLWTEIV